ncbi:SDR family NAD(P)-dependent oxidoreductase [Labedaea rhizosphaerae]|uniref:Phthiocerol/phenolphthiocerol synthesis type-I polyketide synthase C n=1 Tax=Labedaea rhizosphaerae TaxID=598644 RepID=A0A4R6SCD5_LABRH|nr:SDR family NAD(P)-dependent oxidoreductase [Labedaea rhizosphaerae]TDP96605.1 phthiocerol/phenolphthiocerol synthesis type-I polyketide synthase C [Labedaea rhizosphaerae]
MDQFRSDQDDQRDQPDQSAPVLAVVGMAGRLPGSPDLDAFWTLLTGRGTAVTTVASVPPTRWDPAAPLDPELPVPVKAGFLAWIDQFDPAFFGIPAEAAADLDPRQRLMLEVAWQALEDSGVPAASVAGARTGVYVGAGAGDYALLRKQRGARPSAHSFAGTAPDMIAGRVAGFLGITGPSMVVQSGGSSALVALHVAATALRAGEIDAALVGAVNLIITPDATVGRNRVQPGCVRGEGVVACCVKTLAKAQADGDRIRALITTTSAGPAQPPPNLAHVERPDALVAKIGDLEAASGLAGLAKAVLALENHLVPGEQRVQLGPGARVGVATEGAHAVLAAAPPVSLPSLASGPAFVPLSAHSEDALRQRAADISTVDMAPAVLAGTLGRRRDHFPVRAGFIAEDAEELTGLLTEFAAEYEEAPIPGVVTGRARRLDEAGARVAFVFPGHGAQWAGMGRELYAADPVFATVLRRCGQALAPHVDWDLPRVVTGRDDWTAEPDVAAPVQWALAVAIAELWRAAGVSPDVVLGHGAGEIAAATVAGMLSYEDAALVVTRRVAVAGRYAGAGRMLAVGLDARKAMLAAEPFDGALALAADNGPAGCVLAGDTDAVLALKQRFDAVGTDCRLVGEPVAAHSKHVDVLTEDLLLAFDPVHPRAADTELMSPVQVRPVAGDELTARYWTENLRQPVLFADAVDAVFDRGVTHVIEISGRPALTDAMGRLAARRAEPPVVLTSLHEGHAGPRDVLAAFARAYVSGLEPVGSVPPGPPVAVPTYPWQRDTHWVADGSGGDSTDLVLAPAPGEHDTWQAVLDLDQRDHPWLADHLVHGTAVLPAAAMLTFVLGAARSRTGALPVRLDAIRFTEPLPSGEPVRLALVWRDDVADGGSVVLKSLPSGRSAWTEHASARVTAGEIVAPPDFPRHLTDIEPVTAAAFYACCRDGGTDYGPALQGVQALHTNGDHALGELLLPERCAAGQRPHQLHPVLWDAALQVSQALLDGDDAVVPVSATAVHRHRDFGDLAEPVTSGYSYVIRQGSGLFDVHLYDIHRQPLLSVLGLAVRVLPPEAAGPDERVHRLVFVEQSCEERLLAGTQPLGVWLVAGDDTTGIAAELVAAGVKVTQSATVVTEELLREVVPTGLLFLAPKAADGLDRQRAALHELSLTVRAASTLPIPPRVVVLTTGAQPVSDGDLPDPGAALFWGYSRVLRREHPELRSLVLDVDGTVSDAVAAEEIVADEGEDQAALRGGRRYVGRLTRGNADEPPIPAWRGPAQPYRLGVDSPDWAGLVHKPLARRMPGPGEIEVAVTATALSRRDTRFTAPFGADCAGVVTELGPGVTEFEPGDRVIACVPGALASHVTVRAEHAKPVPESMDDADAAAVPLALVTAWHCLHDLARLDADDTVLIHGAAGGVGLAAIAVARAAGATVLATAGTEEKRAHLRALGVADVFDSRTLAWADQVRGRVDVVLNTLPGAAIRLGLDVLADDGRFVELGRHDIGRGHSIGLAPFAKGISVAAADVIGMMDRRPARFARLLDEVWTRVAAGEFAPPPLTRFTFDEASEALRYLADSRHIGRIVLVDPASVRSVAPEPLRDGRLRGDGTYVITGGFGALGCSLAEYLAAHGAGAIALVDRVAPGERAVATVDKLRAAGIATHLVTVDVTDRDALDAAFGVLRAELPPLRGVVHAAGIDDGAPIDELTDQALAAVLAPKVDGAANLHAVTADDPLDLFVAFSSADGLLGEPGQAATAAADAFLDALIAARRTCGRAGLSVQWGPISDSTADGDLVPEQAWRALTGFLAAAERVVGFVPLDLLRFFDAHPDTANQASWQVLWRLTEAIKAESSGATRR